MLLRHFVLNIFVHAFSRDADHIDVELESELRLESNADGLLRFGVDDTFRHIKLEVLVKYFSKVSELLSCVGLATCLVDLRCHL